MLFTLLIGSLLAHAAPASFTCKQTPGYHRKIVDGLTLTLKGPSDFGANYRKFTLTGHLARLSEGTGTEYRDDAGQKVIASAEYDVLPLDVDCLTADANSYLLRCDASPADPLVLRDLAGVEYRFRGYSSDIHHEFSVREHRDLEVNPGIDERVTRTFDFHLPILFFTGQLVAMNRSVSFAASECASQ
jgi:hypothetical protein